MSINAVGPLQLEISKALTKIIKILILATSSKKELADR